MPSPRHALGRPTLIAFALVIALGAPDADAQRKKRNLMIFLRPIILRDAATEAAVSSEKYNYLRTEQLRMRENKELRYRGDKQPLLPELEDIAPRDLFRNPPPIMPDLPDRPAADD